MKKWVFIAYLIMMIGGFLWTQYASVDGDYSDEFKMIVESKVRAPQGATWLIYNDSRYQLVNLGKTRYIFQILDYNDTVYVRVNEKDIIVSLKYEDEIIYTVEDYEENVQGLIDAMHKTMRNITIAFVVVIIILLTRRSS